MSVAAKLAAFAVALAGLFGAGALAGAAIDPSHDQPRAQHGARAADAHGAREKESHMTTATTRDPHGAAHPVRGLAVADAGVRLVVDTPELPLGRSRELRFRIVDERGRTVRDFDVEHERRMHLIVARRDLSGFQHLHPRQTRDGSWSTPLRIDAAGSYRVFADFARDGESVTLAGDLRIDGDADLRPLPAPAATATSDGGYDVRLDAARARPGRATELRFTIARDGHAVHTEPYLGAGGHLVALREGDLAFLHVHPSEHGHGEPAAREHDDSVGFEATFPTAGRYRLFLQFKHAGRVRTVAFTQEVR